jgi:superfamily I DNA/RNA helicase
VLDERRDVVSGHLTVYTMHLAKGLELRAVMVISVCPKGGGVWK